MCLQVNSFDTGKILSQRDLFHICIVLINQINGYVFVNYLAWFQIGFWELINENIFGIFFCVFECPKYSQILIFEISYYLIFYLTWSNVNHNFESMLDFHWL